MGLTYHVLAVVVQVVMPISMWVVEELLPL
jgi:hypothetical protein